MNTKMFPALFLTTAVSFGAVNHESPRSPGRVASPAPESHDLRDLVGQACSGEASALESLRRGVANGSISASPLVTALAAHSGGRGVSPLPPPSRITAQDEAEFDSFGTQPEQDALHRVIFGSADAAESARRIRQEASGPGRERKLRLQISRLLKRMGDAANPDPNEQLRILQELFKQKDVASMGQDLVQRAYLVGKLRRNFDLESRAKILGGK